MLWHTKGSEKATLVLVEVNMAHYLWKLTGLPHAFSAHQLCDLNKNEDHSSPYHIGLLGELNEVINVKYLAPD